MGGGGARLRLRAYGQRQPWLALPVQSGAGEALPLPPPLMRSTAA